MKRFTLVFGLIFVVAAALIAPGWLTEHPTEAAALAVGAVLGVIGAALVIGVFIGGVWTARTMRAGADIAVSAQQVNDEWDAKKTAAFASLMREGATVARQTSGTLPALPLPGQTERLALPPLSELGAMRRWEVIDADVSAGDEAQ